MSQSKNSASRYPEEYKKIPLTRKRMQNINYYEGKYKGNNLYLTIAGIGTTLATMTTTALYHGFFD